MSRHHHASVVEWYRPRLLGRLFGMWLAASFLLGVGVVGGGLALDTSGRIPEEWRGWAMGLGLIGTVLGAVGGIIGIIKLVSEDDRYLLVTRDGLEVSTGRAAPIFIAWRQLATAEDAGGQLLLQRHDGPPVPVRDRYQGIRTAALAARLLECKRKALLGVLRPEAPQRR